MPVAQPTHAVIGTIIMPTAVILSVTDAEVVPIVIRPSVEFIMLLISLYLVYFSCISFLPIHNISSLD